MGEDLFEKFDDKKEEKKKMDKDTVEIKIRFNKFWLERAIFIVIILILLVLVFYNPFGKYRCEKSLSEIKSEPISKIEENQTAKTELEKEPEPEEPVVEEEPEPWSEPEQEPAKELSGKITLEIANIELYENNTKVKSILVKIDNQKKIFTPTLYVYWYDEATEEAVKAKPNGGIINYTGALPPGTVKAWKLDDLLWNRRLRIDDPNKETFKIELYDSKDPIVPIDTKTITVPS